MEIKEKKPRKTQPKAERKNEVEVKTIVKDQKNIIFPEYSQGTKHKNISVLDHSGTKKSQSSGLKGLIAVIRIAGEVKVKPEIANTLYRLKTRRKYSCTLVHPSNKGLMGMLWKVRYSVAYGEIDKDILIKLLDARAQKFGNGKFKAEDVAEELIKGKSLKELGFKAFFRLHPPRKGIKSKLQYPKGVLGNNKEDINKLIARML